MQDFHFQLETSTEYTAFFIAIYIQVNGTRHYQE